MAKRLLESHGRGLQHLENGFELGQDETRKLDQTPRVGLICRIEAVKNGPDDARTIRHGHAKANVKEAGMVIDVVVWVILIVAVRGGT